jgi:autotransporter-associated beta strand protein
VNFFEPQRLRLSPLLFLLVISAVRLAAQTVVLDNFNTGTVKGAPIVGYSWVGQVTQNSQSITVGGTARDDNGWGATGLSLNLSGLNYVRITAQRDAGNLNQSFALQLVNNDTLDTLIVSVAASAFLSGTMTQVQIPIAALLGSFDLSNIGDWSLGGTLPPPGTAAFRMTIDHLAMSNALLPLTGGGTLVTAGNQVYSTAVNLDAATTLGSTGSNGNAITFASTVDGAFDLTLNTPGTTTLNGAVGQSTPLGNLVISGGAAVINGGSVRTSNGQTYNGAVSIGAATLFESGPSGGISFNGALVGNGHAVEISSGGNSSVQTASGLTALTKSGTGTLTFSGASTYSGTTTIRAGTLALGVNNALFSSSPLTMSGGTLALNRHTQTLGLLTITANSVFNFGGSGGTLSFGNSSAQAWSGTLTIANYNTSSNTLRFGTSAASLTPGQLSAIRFADYGDAGGQIDSLGVITPSAIPEPTTWAAIVGAIALGAAGVRRRWRNRGGKPADAAATGTAGSWSIRSSSARPLTTTAGALPASRSARRA